jgi:hypothetical protein
MDTRDYISCIISMYTDVYMASIIGWVVCYVASTIPKDTGL